MGWLRTLRRGRRFSGGEQEALLGQTKGGSLLPERPALQWITNARTREAAQDEGHHQRREIEIVIVMAE